MALSPHLQREALGEGEPAEKQGRKTEMVRLYIIGDGQSATPQQDMPIEGPTYASLHIAPLVGVGETEG